MRKLRHGSMKEYAEGYIASRRWCWDMNPCSLALGSVLLTIIHPVYFNR